MSISIEINNVSLRRSPPFNCIDINDGGKLVLWLKREQAEALRKALDALYPSEAPVENWCDGTHCALPKSQRCRARGGVYICTLPAGHAGNHVACGWIGHNCGLIGHNFHSWPATDALDPGAAEAIARYADEHASEFTA